MKENVKKARGLTSQKMLEKLNARNITLLGRVQEADFDNFFRLSWQTSTPHNSP